MRKTPAIRHDILDFCERELVTLGGGGIEKKMAIIVLVKPRLNYQNTSDFQCMFSAKYVLSLASGIEYEGGAEDCVIVPKTGFCLFKKPAKQPDVETFWRHGF